MERVGSGDVRREGCVVSFLSIPPPPPQNPFFFFFLWMGSSAITPPTPHPLPHSWICKALSLGDGNPGTWQQPADLLAPLCLAFLCLPRFSLSSHSLFLLFSPSLVALSLSSMIYFPLYLFYLSPPATPHPHPHTIHTLLQNSFPITSLSFPSLVFSKIERARCSSLQAGFFLFLLFVLHLFIEIQSTLRWAWKMDGGRREKRTRWCERTDYTSGWSLSSFSTLFLCVVWNLSFHFSPIYVMRATVQVWRKGEIKIKK